MIKQLKFRLSEDERRAVLEGQEITADGPGTILADVEVLLDTIGVEGVATKSKKGNLPSGMLEELNERLADPIELELQRPLLRDFPNVGGVYILLRLLGLVDAGRSRVRVEAARLERWERLNACERYFALFKCWFFDATGEVLGGSDRGRQTPATRNLLFLMAGLKQGWTSFDENVHRYGVMAMCEVPAWSAQLMGRLGLIELRERPPSKRSTPGGSRGWLLGRARRTDWGEAVLGAILARYKATHDGEDFAPWMDLTEEEETPDSFLKEALGAFFPEWSDTFAPPAPDLRPGVYGFRAGYHKNYGPDSIWRRLAVTHKATLDDLHRAMLEAFGMWDDDHAYLWSVRDRRGRERTFRHPFMELLDETDGYASEAAVGALDLPEGAVLGYTIDFGNTCRFELRLERIDPPASGMDRIAVIASEGEALPQYPHYR